MDNILLPHFFFPLVWSFGFIFSPLNKKKNQIYSLCGAIIYIISTIKVTIDSSNDGLYYLVNHPLFFLSPNGLSNFFLIYLSLIFILTILYLFNSNNNNNYNYSNSQYRHISFILFLILWLTTFTLYTQDLLMFFILSELTMFLFYALIRIVNTTHEKVNLKYFIINNSISSMLFFISIIFLHIHSNILFENSELTSESIKKIILTSHNTPYHIDIIFIILHISLILKIGIFPMHGWIKDIFKKPLLANVFMGFIVLTTFYGLTRFILPATSYFIDTFKYIVISLAAFAVIYFGIIAIRKKSLGYFFLSGTMNTLFGLYFYGTEHIKASIFYSVNFTLAIIGLFIINNINKKDIRLNNPIFSFFNFIILFGVASLPITATFIAKLIFIHNHQYNLATIISFTTIIIGLIYIIPALHKLTEYNQPNDMIIETNSSNYCYYISISLIALILILGGIFPQFIYKIFQTQIYELFYGTGI